MCLVDVPRPSPFTSAQFPNLVSLRPTQVSYEPWGPPPYPELLARRKDFPLLGQLRALSLVHHEYLEPDTNLAALEILVRTPPGSSPTYDLPPTLRVLRLLGDSFKMKQPPFLTQVRQILDTAECPLLEELQLSTLPDEDDAEEAAAVQQWCERRGVRLISRKRPSDGCLERDGSFWRFLDNLKDRLGLDV
ncbi:hypothetical protein JCM6882_000365 [Rhodosporidiobolus microsporus]